MMFYSSTVINNSCCSLYNDGLNKGFKRFSIHCEYYHNNINLNI